MAPVTHNGNGSYNWQTLVSTGTLIAILAGGGWALFQSQLQGLARELEITRVQGRDALAAHLHDRERTDAEVANRFQRISDEIVQRRVPQAQFDEWQHRVLDSTEVMRHRLDVIEATRPTTGESQGVINSLKERVEDMQRKVDALIASGRQHQP